MTQGASYGGGVEQSATNYPLVRITNNATGHVFYCRTHDHSSMAVASPFPVSTYFDIPSTIETGAGKLEVVTNGIPLASRTRRNLLTREASIRTKMGAPCRGECLPQLETWESTNLNKALWRVRP